MRKGYISRKDFCYKYNISKYMFKKKLVERGFLEATKGEATITEKSRHKELIAPLHRRPRTKGSFQYMEEYFRIVFGKDKVGEWEWFFLKKD